MNTTKLSGNGGQEIHSKQLLISDSKNSRAILILACNNYDKFPFNGMIFKIVKDFSQGSVDRFFIDFGEFAGNRSLSINSKISYKLFQCLDYPVWRFIKDHRAHFL